METRKPFSAEIAQHIWETKYRFWENSFSGNGQGDSSVMDTWRRVAKSLSEVEAQDKTAWEERFYQNLEGFKFLPAGRILAGAGTGRKVTLFNCFVMGLIPDSMEGIFEALKEGALTMQQGGGVGYDFSSLRPKGTRARGAGTVASGPVSFMRVWDSMCATLLSTGSRRGAMMATLRCDHPDIEEFVTAKARRGELTHFNLSIQVTEDFLAAVKRDESWSLIFPQEALGEPEEGETVSRAWPGFRSGQAVPCRVLKKVLARELWQNILRLAYETAEPGVLFIDRINRMNNLWYREQISATNPCGEIPLPPYGACDLGSINLSAFVKDPFEPSASFDMEGIERTTAFAVRMLDNVIEASRFPLPKQEEMARGTRRIGLGITGLGDALILLGRHYGDPEARDIAASIMKRICHQAYRTSVELAREKETFPYLEKEKYLKGEFIRTLPDEIRSGIKEFGIRNSHLIAIAPAGTISLFAGNISSGIEPVFSFHHTRRVINEQRDFVSFELRDEAFRRFREEKGETAALPSYFVDAHDLDPVAHLQMEAALQPFVDNSISKTINIPEDYNFEDFRDLYEKAHSLGLKGCTVYRPSLVRGEILRPQEPVLAETFCCPTE